jgi:peptide/nickel transport system substrate-binding protein
LNQPAGDFLSILTQPVFAPVPGEYAAHYAVGDNYSGHVVGTGPYTPTTYVPRRTIVLVRNPNWDPATDPLRKAWVDRIQVKLGVPIPSIQQAIEREEADLSLTSHVPQTRIDALRADPEQSRRLSVNPTGSLLYLVLGTNPKAGAIADVRVRQAVNYAIDKAAYRDAIAGRYAAAGELASTILAPGSLGYRPYDLYPTPGGRGDPAKARALLAEAGYPHGLTLGFATLSGRLAAGTKPIEASLRKAGIRLKVTTHREWGPHFQALSNPAKRLEHQLAQSGWLLDYLGDNARQSIVPQYDSRIDPAVGGDFSEYDNPKVKRLIDRALAEPNPARRAALWAQLDQRIMRDAPMVPLVWENYSFQWASRVHGWRYNPWTTMPDLTAVWLDPPSP